MDLRDGNQALVEPMSLAEKLKFFQLLVKIGFKEIEVAFPAASETEYDFVRTLIERNLIPEDVTIQVITQAREHIIRKTFEAIEGASNVIVHMYLSTSVAQREQVFKKDKEEIKKTAETGAALIKELAGRSGENVFLNTVRKVFPGQKWIMPWKSVMPYLMFGNLKKGTRRLLTYPQPWKMQCLMCLRRR